MRTQRPKIGIIGVGFVGSAVKYYYEGKKYPVVAYDTHKRIGTMKDINSADIIFVCVPTPFKEGVGCDTSIVREAISKVKKGKIVVIKSTIIPGTTEELQKEFPDHILLFNPEFLVAKTANTDFAFPSRQIVGYTKQSKEYANMVLDELPPAPHEIIMLATEAEMVKYFCNTFLATRVIFGNQMYDICKALGIDYDLVKEWAGYDPRVGQSHFDVNQDDYRGYGGACLPKDVQALICLAGKMGVKSSLLKTIERINKAYKKP